MKRVTIKDDIIRLENELTEGEYKPYVIRCFGMTPEDRLQELHSIINYEREI